MVANTKTQLTDTALEESLQAGYTLPAEWYTDPAVFALERNRIFRHSWQYVGLTEQLANPGDFFTTRIGDVPLVLTRDQDGQIPRSSTSAAIAAPSLCWPSAASGRHYSATITPGPTTSTARCAPRPAPRTSPTSIRANSR